MQHLQLLRSMLGKASLEASPGCKCSVAMGRAAGGLNHDSEGPVDLADISRSHDRECMGRQVDDDDGSTAKWKPRKFVCPRRWAIWPSALHQPCHCSGTVPR